MPQKQQCILFPPPCSLLHFVLQTFVTECYWSFKWIGHNNIFYSTTDLWLVYCHQRILLVLMLDSHPRWWSCHYNQLTPASAYKDWQYHGDSSPDSILPSPHNLSVYLMSGSPSNTEWSTMANKCVWILADTHTHTHTHRHTHCNINIYINTRKVRWLDGIWARDWGLTHIHTFMQKRL